MQLKFDERGLIPVVVQDRITGQVRMLAWMNQAALDQTLESGLVTFFSRSRGALWVKGETSGNHLKLHSLTADCDGDALLAQVDPVGPSCHTGRQSCFFQASNGETLEAQPIPALFELGEVIHARSQATADKSYTKSLLEAGAPRIGEKIEEEAQELAVAIREESDERVLSEAADVLYHALVGLEARGLDLARVGSVLAKRMGLSGHDEKAQRKA
ncbi:MAG: bifunctional phosphoribosyl-AMP cyclohydrolase/phosphoribosyl-ATP diphosphatase HisIE [Polyangiaceae bacterium]